MALTFYPAKRLIEPIIFHAASTNAVLFIVRELAIFQYCDRAVSLANPLIGYRVVDAFASVTAIFFISLRIGQQLTFEMI